MCGIQICRVFDIERGGGTFPECGCAYFVRAGAWRCGNYVIKTHLKRRNQCVCAISPFRAHSAGVQCPAGIRHVRHQMFRCVGQRRRAYFQRTPPPPAQSRDEGIRNAARSLNDVAPSLVIGKMLWFPQSYLRGEYQRITISESLVPLRFAYFSIYATTR